MIYAYDKAATIPLVDVYDRQMMLAEIGAAKDMYEKGLELMKEFKKDYGDIVFSDPSSQDWYANNFNIGGFINDLYSRGIDPIRSMEGRSLISMYINSRKYGDLNKLKSNDINKKAYDASAAKLGDKYNPDYEIFVHGFDPRTFRSVDENGNIHTFDSIYAQPYTSLLDLVHPSFSSIKPHILSLSEVESRGYKYNPINDYVGIVRADMERTMGSMMPGVRNDTRFLYHRELAKKDLIREGNDNPTDAQIDERLVNNAIAADSLVMTPLEITPNKFALMKEDANQQIRVANAKASIDYDYDIKRAQNPLLNGSRSGSGKDNGAPTIFREAAARLPLQQGPLLTGFGYRGLNVGYDVFNDPHYQWIDPVGEGIRTVKSQKGGNFGYYIPGGQLNRIYRANEFDANGDKVNASNDLSLIGQQDTYFIPSGQMHAERGGDGVVRYYITGTLMNGTGENATPIKDNWSGYGNTGGSRLYEIEVTERAFNYAKKQSEVNAPSN